MSLGRAIRKQASTKYASFHVPGHKGQCVPSSSLASILQHHGLRADLTELPGLDNLACPESAIADAQAAASSVYGARATHFLVNGTSVGIHAAVCACCPPGTVLVASRASHASVFHAVALSGCRACLLQAQQDAEFGIAHGLTAEQVRRALALLQEQGRTVGAVLVTSPSYFGACSHVQAIAQVCEQLGATLIVDEAHGAHLGLHPSLPRSALQQGAHVAVQSTHKTLSALTQAAVLHVGPGAPAGLEHAIKRQLSVLHTSSPSYLLMASLESAIQQAADPACWHAPLQAAADLRSRLADAALPCLHGTAPDACASPLATCTTAVACIDPLRITCLASAWRMTGHALQSALAKQAVVAELATERCVVFALGSGSRAEDAVAAACALEHVGASRLGAGFDGVPCEQPPAPRPAAELSVPQFEGNDAEQAVQDLYDMRAVLHAPVVAVPHEQAIGARSAALVSVYPPGIPALVFGQQVTGQVVEALHAAVAGGASLVGCSADLSNMQVMDSHRL